MEVGGLSATGDVGGSDFVATHRLVQQREPAIVRFVSTCHLKYTRHTPSEVFLTVLSRGT